MFKRNNTGELVVKPRLPSRTKLLLSIGIAVVLAAAAAWIYNYGLSTAGFVQQSADAEQQRLQSDLQRQATENRELRESLARAQRSVQMSETAVQELDRALKGSAQETGRLREELNFYRNIISPVDKRGGLRIQNLYIEPTAASHQYRYKLVLIQALKHETNVRGAASFEIIGTQAGENRVLIVPAEKERSIAVNFKYFQDIEGSFELPRDFRPQRIKVNVVPAGGAQTIHESYAWPLA